MLSPSHIRKTVKRLIEGEAFELKFYQKTVRKKMGFLVHSMVFASAVPVQVLEAGAMFSITLKMNACF